MAGSTALVADTLLSHNWKKNLTDSEKVDFEYILFNTVRFLSFNRKQDYYEMTISIFKFDERSKTAAIEYIQFWALEVRSPRSLRSEKFRENSW